MQSCCFAHKTITRVFIDVVVVVVVVKAVIFEWSVGHTG